MPDPISEDLGRRWVEEYGESMFAFAFRRLMDRESAEDAVQEALLAGLKCYNKFRNEASESTWLIGILRNKIHDAIRRRFREREFLQEVEVSPEFEDGFWRRRPSTWNSLPDQRPQREELREILNSAIDQLPPAMRTAFILREIDELESEKVCEIMGITATNLWTLIHRAKLRLRKTLDEQWFGKEPKK